MTDYATLKRYAFDQIKAYPMLRDAIIDLLELCQSEIADEGSVEHEVELCARDIEQLVLAQIPIA